ncbi:MAG: Asp/Glu racemase [Alphaproteobacteria bacterium]
MSIESAEAAVATLPVTTPVELDAGPGPKGRIGMVALATDAVSELDVARLLPAGEVALYVNRVENANTVTLESLAAMAHDLGRAAAGILPEAPLDAMIYGCTSGTIAIGEEAVFERLRRARPALPCTTPITAARAAFEVLGVTSVAVLTPYIDEINQTVRAHLEDHGIRVVAMASFHAATDSETARIPPRAIRDAAIALDRAEAQALFVSCTALRAIDAIAEIEATLAKPVVTSNQALAWHALRLLGDERPVPGFGRLLEI